jgi:hypothetical protein
MKDPIGVVEAAYSWESDEATWLRRVAESMQRGLASDAGVIACAYDARRSEWIDLNATATVGIDPPKIRSLFNVPIAPGALVQAFRRQSVGTLRQAVTKNPAHAAHYENILGPAVLDQMLCVNARNPTHLGCLFVIPMNAAPRLAPRALSRWRCIAAHVATGFRIHGQLARWSAEQRAAPLNGVDAVLRSDGRIEHAADPSLKDNRVTRTSLRDAVLAFDRARGRLRGEAPDEALEIWKGLVDGRWSLLDHFEADGRRFVLARRNAPETPDIRGLSPRERQVLAYAAMGHSNKAIAYELGLSLSTVATHLAHARAKLGARLPLVIDAMRFGDLDGRPLGAETEDSANRPPHRRRVGSRMDADDA